MKKKIAFILPNLNSGGAERVVTTLANELCNKFEVIIITLSNSNSFYSLHENIRHIKCTNKSLISKNYFYALKNNFYLLKRLKSILSDNKVKLTIGFTTTANILAIIASKKLNINCIISERSNPNIYIPNKLWFYLRKKTYYKAKFIVVQTELILSYFTSYTSKEKLIILPNPIASIFSTKKNRKIPKENIILSVGRLDKNKAQDLLIKAFNNIKNDDWRLIFVGDGIEKQNYINLTNSLKLNSKVSFVGNSTIIFDYYQSSKIFAFTSQSEGFPNVLIEAMYFELPCISTDCETGPSEIISDGENGFLIPVNDQAELESKLSLLMSSESLRNKLGQNALLSIKDYETENVIKRWEELIQKTIG